MYSHLDFPTKLEHFDQTLGSGMQYKIWKRKQYTYYRIYLIGQSDFVFLGSLLGSWGKICLFWEWEYLVSVFQNPYRHFSLWLIESNFFRRIQLSYFNGFHLTDPTSSNQLSRQGLCPTQDHGYHWCWSLPNVTACLLVYPGPLLLHYFFCWSHQHYLLSTTLNPSSVFTEAQLTSTLQPSLYFAQ